MTHDRPPPKLVIGRRIHIKTTSTMKRYSAKLLFEFRVTIDGDPGKMRKCEERIVVIEARSARQALVQAKRRGKSSEHKWLNTDGNPVHFRFIGIMDLLELGGECGDGEVWYDIVDRLLPSERRAVFIPAEADLNGELYT